MASSLFPNPDLPPPSVLPDLLFLFGSLKSDLISQSRSTAFLPELVSPQVYFQPTSSQPGPSAPPTVKETSPVHVPTKSQSWVAKVKSPYQLLSKVASPAMDEDGIPSVQAPDSIVLKSSTLWKDHLVAFFHGTAPSTAKIFSDLNPCPMIRQWVLEAGLWHSGNCSFTMALWTPNLKMSL